MQKLTWEEAVSIRKHFPNTTILEVEGGLYIVQKKDLTVVHLGGDYLLLKQEHPELHRDWERLFRVVYPKLRHEFVLDIICNLGKWTVIGLALLYLFRGMR